MPRRILEGEVVSDKMDKTVTVLVTRRFTHPMYKKIVRKTRKYAAHDENNAFTIGDKVQIEECKPISRRKTWRVISEPSGKGRPAKVTSANDATAEKKAKAEKPAAKKAEAKKAETKKAPAKKATAKKAPAKKTETKKTAAAKSSEKKAPAAKKTSKKKDETK